MQEFFTQPAIAKSKHYDEWNSATAVFRSHPHTKLKLIRKHFVDLSHVGTCHFGENSIFPLAINVFYYSPFDQLRVANTCLAAFSVFPLPSLGNQEMLALAIFVEFNL